MSVTPDAVIEEDLPEVPTEADPPPPDMSTSEVPEADSPPEEVPTPEVDIFGDDAPEALKELSGHRSRLRRLAT